MHHLGHSGLVEESKTREDHSERHHGPEDAHLAVHHGSDAIVSNNRGRQLVCVPSTLEVLPRTAAAVDGRIPVLF